MLVKREHQRAVVEFNELAQACILQLDAELAVSHGQSYESIRDALRRD